MKTLTDFLKTPAGQYSILIGLLLLAIWYIKDQLGEFFAGTGPQQVTEVLPIITVNLTYPLEQYDIWADGLYAAMNFTGTNYGQVEDIVQQMKTDDDVYALINAYGTRTLFVFAIPSAAANLPQALRAELNWPYSLEQANEDLRNAGISAQF